MPRKKLRARFVRYAVPGRPSGRDLAGLEHSDATRAMLKNAGIPVVEIMDVDGRPINAMVGILATAAAGQECQGDPQGRL